MNVLLIYTNWIYWIVAHSFSKESQPCFNVNENGIFNFHNCHQWSVKKRHVRYSVLQHRFSINVWGWIGKSQCNFREEGSAYLNKVYTNELKMLNVFRSTFQIAVNVSFDTCEVEFLIHNLKFQKYSTKICTLNIFSYVNLHFVSPCIQRYRFIINTGWVRKTANEDYWFTVVNTTCT